jgi:hypothetical protein
MDHNDVPCFIPHYVNYKSTDSVLQSHYDYSTAAANLRLNTPINVHIVYIGRGKTYLDQQINEQPPAGTRNKSFESVLIQHQNHYVRVYTNHTTTALNSDIQKAPVLIITDTMNTQFIDSVTVLLPHFLNLIPDYQALQDNPPEAPTNKQLLLKAIMELFELFFDYNPKSAKTSTDYITEINNILNELAKTFKTDHTSALNKFITNISTTRTKNIVQNALTIQARARDDIRVYEESLNKAYERLHNAIIQEAYALNQNPEDMSEFLDMLKNNKHIKILDATDKLIRIKVTAPLKYYRTEDFDVLLNNSKSCFYTHLTTDNQTLLKAAIKANKFQILVQSVIDIMAASSLTDPISFSAKNMPDEMEYMPNPHLTYYSCWSTARSNINTAVKEAKYELIVPQLIAATQSINMSESATFYSRFLPDFNNKSTDTPLLLDPETDKIYTKTEALQLLNSTTTSNSEPEPEPKPYTQTEVEDDDDMWED